MNERIHYDSEKHMAMLQFGLKNCFSEESYTSITIDVKYGVIKFAQINNKDKKALIKTIIIDEEALEELLEIVTLENFDKFNETDHSRSYYSYYDDCNYVHIVAFRNTGMYCAENYTRIYSDDPAETALTWFREKYGLLGYGGIGW